jgi:hypothetical protein
MPAIDRDNGIFRSGVDAHPALITITKTMHVILTT